MLAVFPTMPYQPFMNKEKSIGMAQHALLEWHAFFGRHDLPWRKDMSPYAVLVSEFMLQQTTVATVVSRFGEWMKIFPMLSDLAAAKEETVLSAWEGLGYYARARRLHAAARKIIERHDGVIPREEIHLLALPGVGAYTAAAIRAFAYDEHALVLDTNIIRVLARHANLTTPIDRAEGKKPLLRIADSFYPERNCRKLASALMDLGATLCTSGMPACASCPLKPTCLALEPEQIPKKAARAVTTKQTELRAWYFYKNRLYLEKSPGSRWQGLWILPELSDNKPQGRPLGEITYPITRYRIRMKAYRTTLKPQANLKGFTPAELKKIPIPSPHRRVIENILRKVAV
ncbi:MAG: A/G-specific adenine glycosylase [bacterium]